MKKTAKAAIYTGIGKPFEIREYPLTPPRAGMAGIEPATLVYTLLCH